MRPETGTRNYTVVAVVLHWAIAAAIVGNFALGLWMHEAIDVEATRAHAVAVFQLHKSIGLSVLVLSVIRLLWRLSHRAPPLPANTPAWERIAAYVTHTVLYVLMFAIPLSGWLYVSTQWRGDAPLNVPTVWFGLFKVPGLFALDAAANETRAELAGLFFNSHEFLAWSMLALLVLHVGAALKHQFMDRDEVPGHMIPFLASAAQRSAVTPGRRLGLRLGFAAILIAIVALCWAVFRPAQPAGTDSSSTATSRSDIASVADGWALDPAQSYIRFSGSNAGTPFSGRFTRWQADLAIDAANPSQSRIHVTIWTASAVDGITMHEEALPTREWFAVAEFPIAKYTVIRVIPGDGGSYLLEGELTIKDHTHPVGTLQMQIVDGVVTISGKVLLKRDAFDLGMESDPSGEWVSNEISVDVKAVARTL